MTAYEKNKASVKRYFAKCTRIQIMLNPSQPEDADLIAFLDSMGDSETKGKTAKAILKKYMAMHNALKGIE